LKLDKNVTLSNQLSLQILNPPPPPNPALSSQTAVYIANIKSKLKEQLPKDI